VELKDLESKNKLFNTPRLKYLKAMYKKVGLFITLKSERLKAGIKEEDTEGKREIFYFIDYYYFLCDLCGALLTILATTSGYKHETATGIT
jgi:hypothetical protein